MKNLLVLFLFSIAPVLLHAQSQEPPDGFWGLKFGCPKDSIKQILNERGFRTKDRNDEVLHYGRTEFAGHECDGIELTFLHGKLAYGIVTFTPAHRGQVFDLFNQVEGDLRAKYGEPLNKTRTYAYPYKDRDEDREEALKNGKATVANTWFYAGLNKSERLGSQIVCKITDDFKITLTYASAAYVDIQRRKTDGDY